MKPELDLLERLESVHDRGTFLAFVGALADDRRRALAAARAAAPSAYGPEAGGWENASIEEFLDAAVAWGEAVSTTDDERAAAFAEAPSWAAFARFLYLGKIYE